ncbi:MAG: polyphosphate kinase [Saprospiraceae bacterium]|nr:polyphosphate kinase [Saprospiraceae bacterium]
MIQLSDFPTRAPKGTDEDVIRKKTKDIAKEIEDLQSMMAAQKKHSLLVVFQGMDSSGKDGATREVFKYCSPSGVKTKSYGKPTDLEFAHDFLWRVHPHAPKKGEISVFIRSHYEDVLIQRVHKWIDEEHVTKRINAINAWEELLQFDNNTTILKFYMHLSKERQHEKLMERIETPRKQYKHRDGDWEQRKHWDRYIECYEDVINRSSVPWIIAPVDQRWYRNYFIANEVLKALKKMDLAFPPIQTENEEWKKFG